MIRVSKIRGFGDQICGQSHRLGLIFLLVEISGSHGDEDEDHCLLRCCDV
jgi:hypothetical protein